MKNCAGQSLVEVIVGLTIMMIVVLSLVSVTTTAVNNASFSRNQTLATKYAQESIEDARSQRNTQPEESFFANGSCDIHPPQTIPSTIFTRSRNCVLQIVEGKKTMEVEVVVSWSDARGPHEARLATELTKWQ